MIIPFCVCDHPCLYLWSSFLYLWSSFFVFVIILVYICDHPCLYLWYSLFVFVIFLVWICDHSGLYFWSSMFVFVIILVCIYDHPCGVLLPCFVEKGVKTAVLRIWWRREGRIKDIGEQAWWGDFSPNNNGSGSIKTSKELRKLVFTSALERTNFHNIYKLSFE